MSVPSWLMARPIAHRGYHNRDNGPLENSATAVSAAMERNYSVEVDLQETADGRALVVHDYTLDRLTGETGMILQRNAVDLCRIPLNKGNDKLWLFEELLELVDGKVGLVVEIKSLMRRKAQTDFVRHIADIIRTYKGPLVLKTFDPDMLEVLRAYAPEIPRGILADATRPDEEYSLLSGMDRFMMRHMLHWPRTRPDFISFGLDDLPSLAPSFLRKAMGVPVMIWTVRSPEDREKALRYADQIVFEGFDADNTPRLQR